jgi:hypothetical protein
MRIIPKKYSSPEYHLYPLFESKPKFGITFPKDFFRVNNRIEFINAKTNKINEAKSRLFTEALKKEGFKFPAQLVAGIPSAMKTHADGWFLTDSRGELYHLKMIKGAPYVHHIKTPEGFEIKKIFCTDFKNREFYAMIVTQDNALFTLGNPDYTLTKWPITDYRPHKDRLMINGNLFNRIIVKTSARDVSAYTLNRNYRLIDSYHDLRPRESGRQVKEAAGFIFPFQIHFESQSSTFIKFFTEGYKNIHWLYLNLFLVVVTFILLKIKKKKRVDNLLDIAIVAVTGLYGFIAIYLFPSIEF